MLLATTFEYLAEQPGGLDRTFDVGRDRDNGVGIDAVGEYLTPAVDNLAALRVGGDRAQPLPQGSLDEHVMPEHLQLDETGLDRDPPEGHHAGGDHQAAAHDVAPAGKGRGGRCHRRLESSTAVDPPAWQSRGRPPPSGRAAPRGRSVR